AGSLGRLLHRRGLRTMPAARRPRRLAIDADDIVSGGAERLKARHREIRRPHEGEAELGHDLVPRARGVTPHPTLPLKGGGINSIAAFTSPPPLRGRVREGGAADGNLR